MWIVRLALRRPYTFVVFALLILILGVFSILQMPTDIFPNIDIPVVTVVWQYSGLSAEEMANRIVSPSRAHDDHHGKRHRAHRVAIAERHRRHQALLSATCEYWSVAQAQATSSMHSFCSSLPQGAVPPFINQYNASSVPVLQIGLSGKGLNEQQLFDMASNTIRDQLATVEGAQMPLPYGGRQRSVMVDLNLPALQAKGLSPVDVVNAVSAQNLIAPVGHR